MKSTLAIIGSHSGTRGQYDWTRSDCDAWVFNEALSSSQVLRRSAEELRKRGDPIKAQIQEEQAFVPDDGVSAVFQLHLPAIWKNPKNRNDPHHYEWLKSGNTPDIYMLEAFEEVPRAIKYPLDEVILW